MSRILVHLHLYYLDQCDYFIYKLRCINSCEWDLFVTFNTHDNITENKILKNYPFAKLILVENRGYDIWPFLQVIQTVNIEDYDFVLKLHTKNSNPKGDKINGISYKNYELRNALVDSYLKDKQHFANLLKKMESSSKIGLICNKAFYKNISDGLPEDLSMLRTELERIGIYTENLHFCAGSMLFARMNPYEIFRKTELFNHSTFEETGKSHSIGTMAHVYERIISIVVSANGLKIDTFYDNLFQKFYLDIVVGILQPIFENIFALKRIGEKRIKTLILFGISIPLEK